MGRKLNERSTEMALVHIDPDLLLGCGVVAFLAFLGVAAIGFYVGTVSRAILQ